MKINPIISYTPSYFADLSKNSNGLNAVKDSVGQCNTFSAQYSQISFEGKKKDVQDYKNFRKMYNNFSPEAEDIYENGKNIAKRLGSKEHETCHSSLATS